MPRLPVHQEALLKNMRPLEPTSEELANMSPQEREVLPELLHRNTFGEDYQVDANGRPIEQGVGAPGRETLNHFNAMRKYEGTPGGEVPGTADRLLAEWRARKSGRAPIAAAVPANSAAEIAQLKRRLAQPEGAPAPEKTKRKGNPEGLAKARAAARAKREAAKLAV